MNLFEFVMLCMQAGAVFWALMTDKPMRALYWVGAFIITVAVIKGMK